jgi:hypothetical protein
MSRTHLTYPSTHSGDEIKSLLQRFKATSPAEYDAWVEIERNPIEEDDALAAIQRSVLTFLMAETDWDGNPALASAWVDMRRTVVATLKE